MHLRLVHIFVLVAASTLAALAGCDRTPEPDWGVIWSGTVTDSAVGFAIDSAQIFYDADYPLDTLRLPHLYTDRNGKYTFDTDGIGPYYLIVRKGGYLTQVRQVSATVRKSVKTGIDFKLQKP